MNTEVQPEIDWLDWLQRWDAQQEGYVPEREARVTAMFDELAELLPGSFVALDLACGPGSISQRLLARFPGAQAIAVDIDPGMLAIGRGALGTADGRLRWLEADLASPDWLEALGATQVDAVAQHHRAPLAEAGTVDPPLPRPRSPAAARRPVPQRRQHGLRPSVANLGAPEPACPRRTVDGRRLRRTQHRNGGAVVGCVDLGAYVPAAANRADQALRYATASLTAWIRRPRGGAARRRLSRGGNHLGTERNDDSRGATRWDPRVVQGRRSTPRRGYSSRTPSAAAIASRVFPTPPGPTNVKSRTFSLRTNDAMRSRSESRPMSTVGVSGSTREARRSTPTGRLHLEPRGARRTRAP